MDIRFMAGTTPFEFTKNWRFTIINAENVYARAMNRVDVRAGLPLEPGAAMRGDGAARFGGRFSASRRVLRDA